jgi:hypothetical protein
MTAEISDKVRAAMERLDQAIDRLDAKAVVQSPAQARAAATAASSKSNDKAVADRLDRMIERIESALAG